MKIYLLTIVFLFSTNCFAQTIDSSNINTQVKYDKLELKNGTVYLGKVEKVKTDIIEFKESETNLPYEFEKSKIRYIALTNGKILTFEDYNDNPNKDRAQSTIPPVEHNSDDSSPVGLVIFATVGVVLLVLVLIGAAAQ